MLGGDAARPAKPIGYRCSMSVNPQPNWRASDADRQRVADLLTTAYADGRLDRGEFDQRLEDVWLAKTFGDLAPITSDLGSGAVPSPASYLPQITSPSLPAVPDAVRIGVGPATRSSFNSFMSSEKHGAGTQLAADTQFTSVMGDMRFDLRGGLLGAAHNRFDTSIVMGSIVLIVPEGVNVIDQTTKVMGSTTIKGIRPRPDGPTITITGFNLMGEVKVIGPDDRRYPKK